jgi:Mn-dependent DtxR family transcriptional regulator
LHAEKYGEILLTDKGSQIGEYLLYRHDVLQRFLCRINHSDNELEQVEKIEHFLDKRTIKNLELLLQQL